MRIECPACGVSGTADDSYEGRKIRCPKCNEVFVCSQEEAELDDPVEESVQTVELEQPGAASEDTAHDPEEDEASGVGENLVLEEPETAEHVVEHVEERGLEQGEDVAATEIDDGIDPPSEPEEPEEQSVSGTKSGGLLGALKKLFSRS